MNTADSMQMMTIPRQHDDAEHPVDAVLATWVTIYPPPYRARPMMGQPTTNRPKQAEKHLPLRNLPARNHAGPTQRQHGDNN